MFDAPKLTAVLSEFAATLTTDFPIATVLERLVGRIVEVVPVSSAGLTMIDPARQPHFVAASNADARHYENLQSALTQGPCLIAFETGSPVSVPDLATDRRFPAFTSAAVPAGLAAVFAFPLRHGDSRFGALDLYLDVPRRLEDATMRTAQTLADVAGAYLLNDRARTDVQELSEAVTHDALTGLPNQRLLEARIEHARERASRSGAWAAVLFIDLDRFKLVNDTFGHAAGDTLIRDVADRLRARIRPGDTLARMYGDEFVLLCEDLDGEASGDLLAERIMATFRAPFTVAGVPHRQTATVGIAFAGPAEGLSTRQVSMADRDMYAQKHRKYRDGGPRAPSHRG